MSPSGDAVATAGPDTTARVWEARTGKEVLRLSLTELATAVAFDDQGKRIATSDESGAVCLWNAKSGQQVQCMSHGLPVYWLGFSPSSALLASIGLDGSVAVWDTGNGQSRWRFQHDKHVRAARFDPTGKMLASFGSDTETIVWSLETGEPWRMGDDNMTYAGVVFDAATDTMIVPGDEGVITWWDLKTRRPRFSMSADSIILGAAASPERRHLVTIDGYRETRAWSLDDGRLLKRLPYYQLYALAISPDGESLAVAGFDGERDVIDVTRIAPKDLVAAACERLSRNLTREEWQRYRGDRPYQRTCPNLEDGQEPE